MSSPDFKVWLFCAPGDEIGCAKLGSELDGRAASLRLLKNNIEMKGSGRLTATATALHSGIIVDPGALQLRNVDRVKNQIS